MNLIYVRSFVPALFGCFYEILRFLIAWQISFCPAPGVLSSALGCETRDNRQTTMLVTGKMVITVINLMRIFIDFSLHISITFNSSHHYTRWRKINQNPSLHNNQTIVSSVPCTMPDSSQHVQRSTYHKVLWPLLPSLIDTELYLLTAA